MSSHHREKTNLSSLGRSGGRSRLLILLTFFVLFVNLDGGGRSRFGRFGRFGHFRYSNLLFEMEMDEKK